MQHFKQRQKRRPCDVGLLCTGPSKSVIKSRYCLWTGGHFVPAQKWHIEVLQLLGTPVPGVPLTHDLDIPADNTQRNITASSPLLPQISLRRCLRQWEWFKHQTET